MTEVLLTCPVCGLETPQRMIVPPGLKTGDKIRVHVECAHCDFTGSTVQRYSKGQLTLALSPSDFTGHPID